MILLVVLIIIACLALGFFVLIQEAKGGGLASNFAGSNQIMGVRKTTNFLEKATWGLAIAIIVLCLGCAFMTKSEFAKKYNVQTAETERTENIPAE